MGIGTNTGPRIEMALVDVMVSRDLPEIIPPPHNTSVPMTLWRAADEGEEQSVKTLLRAVAENNRSFIAAAEAVGINVSLRLVPSSVGLTAWFSTSTEEVK
jgi:hypothetical protein